MALFETQIDGVRRAFERLTQREQVMVLGAAAAVGLVMLLGAGLMVSSAISKAEHRVTVKTKNLSEVLALEGQYRARKQDESNQLNRLKRRSKVRLVKVVEDAARNSGIEIGQLQPEEGEPNEDGIYESRVSLRAKGLSVDRLQDFINRLESSRDMVVIRRMKLDKPYRKETLDLDLEVTTYGVKS